MRKLFGTVLAALFAVTTTHAAEIAAPAARLTLDEAVARARAASPSIAGLKALESAAESAMAEARSGRRPSVEASAAFTRNSNVPELTIAFPGSTPRTLFPNIPDNYRARVGAGVPLYTGGRLNALGEAASSRREAAGRDTATGEADVVLETTAAFWNLVTSRESVSVLSDGLATYDQHLADARHREVFGLAPRSEALLVQVERDRAELARLEAANAAEVAEADLARLTGLEPGTHVEPAEPPAGVSSRTETADELVVQALAARPERAALDARRRALEASARVDESARRPQVSASAGYDYADPNRNILPVANGWKDSWSVSLNFGISLYDGGRAKAAAARSRAQADAVARALDELDRRIRLEVVARRLDLEAARQGVAVAEHAVTAADEARRIVRDRYLEGVGTNADYLDAELAFLRAGLDRTAANARARIARARLDRAVGR